MDQSREIGDEILGEFDSALYLDSGEAVTEYLRLRFEAGPEAFAEALGVAARAYEMHGLGQGGAMDAEGLRQHLLAEANPRLGTAMDALHTLGLGVTFTPIPAGA